MDAAQTNQNFGDHDISFNDTGLRVLPTESNEPVKELLHKSLKLSTMHLSNEGKNAFCEEYE